MLGHTYLATADTATVAIKAGVPINWERLSSYRAATQEKNCQDIHHYDLPNASRGLTEMLLICQALHLGGIKPQFDFIQFDTYARLLRQVSNGGVDIMLESAWKRDADPDKVYVSDPILHNGEFEVGLFVHPRNSKALSTSTLEQLRQLTAITNKNWVVDWETLEHMDIKKN